MYGLHDTGDTKSGLKTIPRVVGQPRFKSPLSKWRPKPPSAAANRAVLPMDVPVRQPWLRSCDWFLICTSLIVTVARSSSAILMSAGEDSLFVNFLSLCIFIVLVVDVIGSVLWMVLTLSTEPFVVEEQHEGPDGEKFAARSDDVDRERSASGNRSNLSARKYSINKENKKEPEEQSTQSAPQLSTLSGGPSTLTGHGTDRQLYM